MAVVAAASPEIPVLALGAEIAAATTVGIGATRVGVGLTGDAQGARWGLGCLTHSFAPDTPVLMADGTTKRIDEIEIGDQVLTTDPESDATTTRPVTAIHRHRDTDLTDLTIVDDHGNQAILRTTQHHQIWDDTHHKWTDASQLQPGTALRTPTEAPAHVAGTANRTGTATMHDLTIADIHTYYVMAGGAAVLVHNCGPGEVPYFSAYPREFLDQAAKYGKAGVRELPDGRFRFYGDLTEARTPGEMVGRRLVREWTQILVPLEFGTKRWMGLAMLGSSGLTSAQRVEVRITTCSTETEITQGAGSRRARYPRAGYSSYGGANSEIGQSGGDCRLGDVANQRRIE